jgi:hypothetical protein
VNLNFKKNGLVHTPIKYWELTDGNFLIMYQGNRGDCPDLDFIIKYKNVNSRLRAPSHTHWIVDLLLKSQLSPDRVCQFIKEWIDIYEIAEPFKTQEERVNYDLVYTEFFVENYWDLDNIGSFSVEFLSALLEMFVKCEKQTKNAFMFKNLLVLVKEYCEGTKDFYQVVSYSKRV